MLPRQLGPGRQTLHFLASAQVGQALSSVHVDSLEGGFHEEHLELLPQELELVAGPDDGGGDGSDEGDA